MVFAKEQQTRSEVKAEAGASATLSCKVAQAQTEVTWFKDGKKLSSGSKVRVEASGCERRLVVQQAGKADAGEYSCEAGGQKVSFRLDVTGGCQGCAQWGYFRTFQVSWAGTLPVLRPQCLFVPGFWEPSLAIS